MKALGNIDPLAIESIEFNFRKIKKYTSLFTIFLSLLALILSVLMNMSSLEQIWIPRKDLTIT
jgi:hypothetical protein